MIRITADGNTLSFTARGHAGYGPKGQDIVCAGVSTLLYSYAQELLKLKADPVIKDTGDVFEVRPGKTGEKERTAFEMTHSGLRMMADSYGDCVAIRNA